MKQKISESKDISSIVGSRSNELVENVVQNLKKCRKVPIISGSGYIHVKAIVAGKTDNRL